MKLIFNLKPICKSIVFAAFALTFFSPNPHQRKNLSTATTTAPSLKSTDASASISPSRLATPT